LQKEEESEEIIPSPSHHNQPSPPSHNQPSSSSSSSSSLFQVYSILLTISKNKLGDEMREMVDYEMVDDGK